MSQPLVKVSTRLQAGDRERLQALYPDISYQVIIRRIIQKFLNNIETKAGKDIPPTLAD